MSNVFSLRRVAGTMLAAAILASSAYAQAPKATAVDLLFERKHLENVKAGDKLSYRFSRDVTKPDLLGQPFADDVTVDIRKIAADGTREVDVRIFTGERARDPQVIDGMTGNPILVIFLDRSVSSYVALAGGKVPYLKDRFRSALRDRATIEPVKVKLGDKTVDGHRVTISPYSSDPNASKMQGYENSSFSVVVSDAAPGHFVELSALYENTKKEAPRLEEKLVMAGAEVLK